MKDRINWGIFVIDMNKLYEIQNPVIRGEKL
ncbi:MAG: hypothetical protein DDT22_00301 [candidate division WS2 bacterium]|nr:hypothetical protein [Candidatus Lithacetigena glycinireducens]